MKKSIFGCEEQRFGIRKYSVGVASVLIASVLVMGGQTVAGVSGYYFNGASNRRSRRK
ncbi:YSIRK-type signal peptide-containing protein [Streptococcus gallolyticus]